MGTPAPRRAGARMRYAPHARMAGPGLLHPGGVVVRAGALHNCWHITGSHYC